MLFSFDVVDLDRRDTAGQERYKVRAYDSDTALRELIQTTHMIVISEFYPSTLR